MKKNILLVPVLLMLFLVSFPAHAQTIKSDQILAYVSRANVALTNNNWNSALESVNEAQKLAGLGNIAAFELIRLRAYQGKKDVLQAMRSSRVFTDLNPNQTQKNEAAPYRSMIDDEIQEEKDRIAELQKQDTAIREEEERKRVQAEEERKRIIAQNKAEYERIYASVNVGAQAVALGNRAKNTIQKIYNPEYYESTALSRDEIVGYHSSIEFPEGSFSLKYDYSIYHPDFAIKNSPSRGLILEFSSLFQLFDCMQNGSYTDGGGRITVSYTLSPVKHVARYPEQFKVMGDLGFSIERNPLPSNVSEDTQVPIVGCWHVETSSNSVKQTNKRVYNKLISFADSKIAELNNRISFSQEEIIAFYKDEEEFNTYFNMAFFAVEQKTYAELRNENQRLEASKTRLNALKKELDSIRQQGNTRAILDKLTAYRDQKTQLDYGTQEEDREIGRLKKKIAENNRQTKVTFEQYLSEGKSAIEKKQYEYALEILEKAKDLKESNPEIYFGGDYEIEDPIRKAEEELAGDQNALLKSTELVVNDNRNLAFEKQILERAILQQPENESFKQKLEQVNLRLKVVTIIEKGDGLLAEDKISEAIDQYESALEIMPGLDVVTNKIQNAQKALSLKSQSKHQLLEEIQSELRNTDEFDDVAKEKARQKVLDYIKDFPDDVELLVTATDLFIQEKLGLEDAYNMTQTVLKSDPENVANLNNLGEIFYLNNQTEESMSAFQQAWNLGDKDNPNTLKRLTQGNYTLYLRTKEIGYAQKALKAALYAQNLSLDDPVFSRVTTNLCNTNENLSCNE
jgi:hypothetical protein